MMTEAIKKLRDAQEIAKISFLTAAMRRTESSLNGTDKKLEK